MWQRQDWAIPALIGALILIGAWVYIYVPQLVWFFFTLISATVVLFLIGVAVFYISKRLSKRYLHRKERRYINIIFAGTIIIALSQLFGPLFGAFYPLILGPDASDYNLAFSSRYYNVTFNYSTNQYDITSFDNPVPQHYPPQKNETYKRGDQISFSTNISAADLNPLMRYNEEIFLDVIPPNKVNTSVENPVINVGQSSKVIIYLNPDPDQGTYSIEVQGEGGNGKIRKAMTVIGVPKKIESRWFTPSRPNDQAEKYLVDQLIAMMGATAVTQQYASSIQENTITTSQLNDNYSNKLVNYQGLLNNSALENWYVGYPDEIDYKGSYTTVAPNSNLNSVSSYEISIFLKKNHAIMGVKLYKNDEETDSIPSAFWTIAERKLAFWIEK